VVLIKRRIGIGVRDRRRCVARPQARDPDRDPLVRQGLGADHHPARHRQRRVGAHHRALFHAVGTVDPGQGITPDIEVLQDVPDELKGRVDTKGEASMRGHLSPRAPSRRIAAYVPPDEKNDKRSTRPTICCAASPSTPMRRRPPRRRFRTEPAIEKKRFDRAACGPPRFVPSHGTPARFA